MNQEPLKTAIEEYAAVFTASADCSARFSGSADVGLAGDHERFGGNPACGLSVIPDVKVRKSLDCA